MQVFARYRSKNRSAMFQFNEYRLESLLVATCEKLGIVLAEEKSEGPAPHLTVLVIEIDSRAIGITPTTRQTSTTSTTACYGTDLMQYQT